MGIWEKGGGIIVSITLYNTTLACSFTFGLSLSSQWPLVPWGLPLHRWALRWRQGARGWEDGRAWSQGLPINSLQLLHAELLPVACRQKIWSRYHPHLWKGEKRFTSAPFKEKKFLSTWSRGNRVKMKYLRKLWELATTWRQWSTRRRILSCGQVVID